MLLVSVRSKEQKNSPEGQSHTRQVITLGIGPDYLQLKQEIMVLIREESMKAMDNELSDGDGFGMKVGPEGLGALLGL